MKPAALLLLGTFLFAANSNDILRIDHVTIAGRTLAALESALAPAGLKFEPGGPHTNHATEMSIASFPDGSYIELIARQPNFDSAMLSRHSWAKLIEGDAGPTAWAVRPKDFAAEIARLHVKPEAGSRVRPDNIKLEWETAGDPGHGIFLPFLIRDVTPRPDRAYPSGKPANRDETGIIRVVIAVAKLSDAIERFTAAYPSGHPLKTIDPKFGAELAWLPDSPVIFAQPLGSSSWVAGRIERFGGGPCAFILGSKKDLTREWSLTTNWFGREVRWFTVPATSSLNAPGWWLGVQRDGI